MPADRKTGARVRRIAGFGAAGLLLVTAGVQGQADRCLTEQARLDLPTVAEVRIHPEGRAALYTVVELSGPTSTIYRWDEAVDRRREVARGAFPRWSPRGERAAFLSTAQGGRQIWVAEGWGGPGGGSAEVERVSDHPGGVREFAWSPDGRRIAFAAIPTRDTDGGDAGDPADARGASDPARDPVRGFQLHLLDLQTGETRVLTDVPGSVHVHPFGGGGSFAWSPDASRLAFSVQPDRSVEAAYRADLWLLDVEAGRLEPLVEREGLDIRPAWSPDGRRIAFTTSFGRVDRLTAHGLATVSVETGEVADLGEAVDAAFLDAPVGHAWTRDGGILTLAARGLRSVLLRVDATTGEITEVLDPPEEGTPGTLAGITFSADRRRAAYLWTDPDRPWEARLVALGGDAARPEVPVEIARPAVVPGGPVRWEVVEWQSPEGIHLRGLLFHPCRAVEGSPPVVTWLHGGPEGRATLGFDPTSPIPGPSFDPLPTRGLLARGYAVFMPNFRLSAGYPAAVRKRVTGRVPEALAADVLSGLDALVERGVVDPGRLALAGWASGGLYAAQLLTRTDRFRAAVVGAANTDLQAAYGDGDFAVQWHSLQGGPPWAAREAWDEASPLRNAERISAAVLLLHGEADDLVPADHSRYLHTYLRGLGRDVELELLPGVGHGVLLPAQRLPVAERVYAWLERWLG